MEAVRAAVCAEGSLSLRLMRSSKEPSGVEILSKTSLVTTTFSVKAASAEDAPRKNSSQPRPNSSISSVRETPSAAWK